MNMPTAISSTLSRNGIRQPHAVELFLGQVRGEQVEHDRGEQRAGGDAHLRPASGETAAIARRMLHRHQHGAAPLPSNADALNRPQHDEQNGRPDADGRVRGKQSDEERRDAHDDERIDQHGLAADAIAEVAEHDAAQGPRDEPDGERPERGERADQRIDGRKEEPVEDERRGSAVKEEVVPLDRGADEARENHLADGSWIGVFHGRGSLPLSHRGSLSSAGGP